MSPGNWILMPLGTFALAVLLHGLAMRLPLRIDSVRRFLLVGLPLGLALLAGSFFILGLSIAGFASVALYALLCELYMFFFTLVLSSVSATMLILLRKSPIDAGKLAATYDPGEMVSLRVGRLIDTGFIEKRGEVLAVSEKGIRLHRTFTLLRYFFGHESSQG